MFQTKVVEKMKTHFMLIIFFLNRALLSVTSMALGESNYVAIWYNIYR